MSIRIQNLVPTSVRFLMIVNFEYAAKKWSDLTRNAPYTGPLNTEKEKLKTKNTRFKKFGGHNFFRFSMIVNCENFDCTAKKKPGLTWHETPHMRALRIRSERARAGGLQRGEDDAEFEWSLNHWWRARDDARLPANIPRYTLSLSLTPSPFPRLYPTRCIAFIKRTLGANYAPRYLRTALSLACTSERVLAVHGDLAESCATMYVTNVTISAKSPLSKSRSINEIGTTEIVYRGFQKKLSRPNIDLWTTWREFRH